MEVYSDSREGHGRGRRYIAPIGQFSLSHDDGARSDRPGTYGYQRDGNVQQYNALEIGGEHRMDHTDHVPKFAAPASGRSRDHDWYGTPVNRSEHVDDGMRATTDQLDLGGSNLDNAQVMDAICTTEPEGRTLTRWRRRRILAPNAVPSTGGNMSAQRTI
eukprot:GEMP01041380.1.p2 GENE.GEMP01041380.1~~GEMP01041380.1.p2  ORF type:complete len:160 (+),score=36.99 GEMP01041380.1:92-571(+)